MQLSTEKLPPGADENKYRDPQPDNIQRMRHLETQNSKSDVSIKSLPSGSREHCWKGGRKTGKSRGDGESSKQKINMIKTYMNSRRLREHVQLLAWICPWSLACILCLPLGIFMGFLNVNVWVSVSCALSRALLFLFTSFAQPLCVIFVLTYYILTLLLSLRSLFIF